MTRAQRAALQGLTEEASPGPWDVDWNGPLTAVHASDGSGKHVAKAATVADAAFIAAAREAVPELLDALDAAEAESKRLQYACDGAYAQAVTTGEHLDEAEARVETLEAALRDIAAGETIERDGVVYVRPAQEFASRVLGDAG